MKLRTLLTVCLVALTIVAPAAATDTAKPPNILLILTDDQGWGDYLVTLNYVCPASDVGAEIEVEVAGVRIQGKITEAHDPAIIPSPDRVPRKPVYEKVWKPLAMGMVSIPKGETRLTVRALSKPGQMVMDLKSVVLERKE